jgi:hypothetical protein
LSFSFKRVEEEDWEEKDETDEWRGGGVVNSNSPPVLSLSFSFKRVKDWEEDKDETDEWRGGGVVNISLSLLSSSLLWLLLLKEVLSSSLLELISPSPEKEEKEKEEEEEEEEEKI